MAVTEDQVRAQSFTDGEAKIAPAVLAQLKTIISSPEFFRSPKMAAFLTVVVHASLANEKHKLTERSIGESVFGKESGWDPRGDTIVRSEARRLRRKLSEYYSGSGKNSTVLVDLPLGGYLATFTVLPQESPKPAASELKIKSLRKTWLWSVLAIVAAMLLTIIALRHRKTTGDTLYVSSPLANAVGKEFSPAFSPDGKQAAYVWDSDNNNFDIYIKNIDAGSVRRLTNDAAPDLYPAWSPDGSHLAFLRMGPNETGVMVIDAQGQHERVVTQIRTEFGRWAENLSPLLGDPGPVWTPDGKALVVSDAPLPSASSNGLYRVDIESGLRTQITSPSGEARDFSPRFSPDGHRLAFVRYFTHGVGDIFTLSTTSPGQPEQLTRDGRMIRGLSWLPSSKELVFASNRKGPMQLWTVGFDSRPPRAIMLSSGNASEPEVSRDGHLIAYVDSVENWNIWRMILAGDRTSQEKRLIASSGINKSPVYSNDGRMIAFLSDRSGNMEIWLCTTEGTELRRLTDFKAAYLGSLAWSPDDRTIAVDARRGRNSQIYTVSVENGAIHPVDSNSFEERTPSWSPDGKSLLFNSNRGGEVEVWRISLSTLKATKIARAPFFEARFEPAGNRLLLSDVNGKLYTGLPDGSELKPLNAVSLPVAGWTACSAGIVVPYDSPQENGATLTKFSGAKAYVLGKTQNHLGVNSPDLSVSPDCRSLLYVQQDHVDSDIRLISGWAEGNASTSQELHK